MTLHTAHCILVELCDAHGNAIAQSAETLCYKSEGCVLDSRWGYWISNWPNPSSRTMALGSTLSLTEISTRNLPGGKGVRHVRFTTSLPSVSRFPRKCGNLDLICLSSDAYFLRKGGKGHDLWKSKTFIFNQIWKFSVKSFLYDLTEM
jgi:hypothetical protein